MLQHFIPSPCPQTRLEESNTIHQHNISDMCQLRVDVEEGEKMVEMSINILRFVSYDMCLLTPTNRYKAAENHSDWVKNRCAL